MALVTINFVGPWRLFLGVGTITVDAGSIDDVRNCIETRYQPVYAERLQAKGIHKKPSVWDQSNILLNGKNIRLNAAPRLNDGDTISLLPQMAGG